MYQRTITHELITLAAQFPIVTVLGPRQAGKSTLCRTTFPEYGYISLEDPDIRDFAENDPRGFLRQYNRKVILDEIQRVPQLLSYLQGIVDQQQERGQFILTGSHQFMLASQVSQSLAGRTALLYLLPLSFEELPQAGRSAAQCVWEGFMPGRHSQPIDVSRYYRSYFQTYVERDVRLLLNVKDLALFEKCVRLCAGRIGQVLNVSSLASDVGVSSHTINDWLSVLEASFIILRLQPYFENFGKRLIKSPKLYFVDTGLASWILGIERPEQLARDPLWGCLFENLVILEAFKARLNRGLQPNLFYFRDSHGHEVDLILATQRQLHALEIKAAETFHRSFLLGLSKFAKLTTNVHGSSTVVYGGDIERQTNNYQLLSFAHTYNWAILHQMANNDQKL